MPRRRSRLGRRTEPHCGAVAGCLLSEGTLLGRGLEIRFCEDYVDEHDMPFGCKALFGIAFASSRTVIVEYGEVRGMILTILD